jgi:ABC-type transport system involved in multi-copper enzyme maturation permease subunit
MWTLIKREIKDNIIMFLLALILAGVCEAVVVSGFLRTETQFAPVGIPKEVYGIFAFFIILLSLAAAVTGGTQMYLDKNKKVCAFLSTLAVTRRQILTAKMFVGLIWLLVALLPLIAAELILFQVKPRLIPVDYSLLIRMYIVTGLCALSCYLLGSNLGLGKNRTIAVLGGAFFCLILISLIIIKGFGPEIMLVFGITSAALAVRVWNVFMSIPL